MLLYLLSFYRAFDRTGLRLEGDYASNIEIPVTRITHHGTYQCKDAGREYFSYPGSLTVEGKSMVLLFHSVYSLKLVGAVLMRFLDSVQQINGTGGQDIMKKFVVFGAPDPTLSITKEASNGDYIPIDDDRITLSLTSFTFTSLKLSDAGQYKIWGNNTYGNSSFSFRINVSGMFYVTNITHDERDMSVRA